MLTGSFPWNYDFDRLSENDRDSISTMIIKGRKTDAAPPSTYNDACSKNLDRITLKAINKELEERYLNASEFLDDLVAEQMNNVVVEKTQEKTQEQVEVLYY
jgi:serine/threonine protein kinase